MFKRFQVILMFVVAATLAYPAFQVGFFLGNHVADLPQAVAEHSYSFLIGLLLTLLVLGFLLWVVRDQCCSQQATAIERRLMHTHSNAPGEAGEFAAPAPLIQPGQNLPYNMVDGTELLRRANNLSITLRNMRKWGFTIIQDNPGLSQSEDVQMQRARVVAAELLGCDAASGGPEVNLVAQALLQTAEACRQLSQFR